MKVTCCLCGNYNSAFSSTFGSVKHAMLRWCNITQSMWLLKQVQWNEDKAKKKYVLKDSMIYIGFNWCEKW